MEQRLYSCLLSAGLALTLISCSEDMKVAEPQGRSVTLSVNVSRGGESTRSILEEENGNLKCTWEATDLILVTDNAGNKLGILELKEGAGEGNALFKGEINTTATGETALNFLYIGSKSQEDLQSLLNPVTIDYSSQDGTLEWLQNNDFFAANQTVIINNSETDVESVTLARQLSFGKFEIKLPEGVTYNGETITVSGPGVYTKASISMTDGEVTFSENGAITITKPEDETTDEETNVNEFYLAILPTGESITPTFKITVGEKTYSSTLTARTWKASEFVRKDNKNGTYSGILLDMNESNDPYKEYANEDPRNPLHIFAKYNLTRIGDEENDFAEADDNGALYQWGRNHGFVDTKGLYENSSVFIVGSTDYINYLDAMGMPDTEVNDNLWGTQGYFVYEPNASGYYNNRLITSATGGYSDGLRYYETPWFYNTLDHLKANKYGYCMNAVPNYTKIEGYGSGYAGVDEYTANDDYWVESAFKNGGSKWGERAKKGDYENENPCPENWRLPTLAEMKAIAPENGLYKKNGDLSTLLSGYAEVRVYNGIRYAIRWILQTSGITVECIVLEDNSITQASQLDSYFWDSNATKKVVREFPYTGGIRPFVANSDGYSLDDTLIARPMPMGKADIGFYPFSYGQMTIIGPNESPDYPVNAFFGGYWVEEKGKAFVFCSKNYARRVDTASQYTRIRIEDAGPVMGYAIRPVMDLKKTTEKN